MNKNEQFNACSQFLLCPGRGAEYCDQPVCVCLSVCEHISGTASPILTKFCVQIPCGCGSVLLWRRCATSCTSGFMDDVTFTRNGRDVEMWRLHRAATAMSDVAIPGRSLMSMNACLTLRVSASILNTGSLSALHDLLHSVIGHRNKEKGTENAVNRNCSEGNGREMGHFRTLSKICKILKL